MIGAASGGTSANALRGEAEILLAGTMRLLRPSFGALVAAEAELGPLLGIVDRAAEGRIGIAEMAGLIWHCLADRDALPRESCDAAVVELGLARVMPAVRTILHQVLAGAA